MSRGRRGLTSEEEKLWRRVTAAVRQRRAKSSPPPAPPPEQISAPISRRRPAPPPPAIPPRQACDLNRAGEKRVRRGRIEVGATLDLHGHTQHSARAALARFLEAAQARGLSAVVVVTGVGRAGEGVLRRRLPEWLLEADLRPLTSGYAQAHRIHGGAGAFYVFVKRRRSGQ